MLVREVHVQRPGEVGNPLESDVIAVRGCRRPIRPQGRSGGAQADCPRSAAESDRGERIATVIGIGAGGGLYLEHGVCAGQVNRLAV